MGSLSCISFLIICFAALCACQNLWLGDLLVPIMVPPPEFTPLQYPSRGWDPELASNLKNMQRGWAVNLVVTPDSR